MVMWADNGGYEDVNKGFECAQNCYRRVLAFADSFELKIANMFKNMWRNLADTEQ